MNQSSHPHFVKNILVILGVTFAGSIVGIGYFLQNSEARDRANFLISDRFNMVLDAIYPLWLYFQDPNEEMSAGAYNNLGLMHFNEKNYEQAEYYYLEAIRLDPGMKNSYNNLGNTYASQDKFEEALEYYKKAITIDPLYVKPHHNIGSLYMNSWFKNMSSYDNLLESQKWFEKAIELGTDWHGTYQSLGRSYLKLSRKDHSNLAQAEKYLLRAIELEQDDSISHVELGYVYYHQGRSLEAKKEWEIAKSLGLETEAEDKLLPGL